jgi:hypothetical protein
MSDPTHRLTIAESELSAVTELLQAARQEGLTTQPVNRFLAKLMVLQTKIGMGTKVPDYVKTGAKEARTISLDNLGATDADFKMPTPARSPVSPTHLHMAQADLDAELERLNAQMLEEQALAGNKNVVLEERRKHPRNENNLEEAASADAELFKSLSE